MMMMFLALGSAADPTGKTQPKTATAAITVNTTLLRLPNDCLIPTPAKLSSNTRA